MDTVTSIEKDEYAKAFHAMAERIERNPKADFGGAMVIVSPQKEIVDVLLVGTKADNVHFWATIKNKMEAAVADAIAAEETKQGRFPQRR